MNRSHLIAQMSDHARKWPPRHSDRAIWRVSREAKAYLQERAERFAKELGMEKPPPDGHMTVFGIPVKVSQGQTEPFYLEDLT